MNLKSILKNKIFQLPYNIITILSLFIISFFFPLPGTYLSQNPNDSVKIYDRHKTLLLELNRDTGGFTHPVHLTEIPDDFLKLLLFSEDRDFYRHSGISLKAIGRATVQNIQKGKIVSGGSTISQQLARIKLRIAKSNIFTKIAEIFLALKIDLYFTKSEILQSYINQAYLGNQIYGFGKAAEIYFGKPVKDLDFLEFAALVCVIRSPSAYDIYKRPALLKTKALDLLQYAKENPASGLTISDKEIKIYNEIQLSILPFKQPFYAPHFCYYVWEEAGKVIPKGSRISEIVTTMDLNLYLRIQDTAGNQIALLEKHGAKHAGAVMIDNQTREILAMIGSVNYFEDKGQINAVTMKRQLASTMKPFNYALAFESRRYTPSSILPDIYTEYSAPVGKYIPQNYNDQYHGPVRAAVALGSSYNVPAVYLLDKMGLYSYYRFLKKIGFDSLVRSPSYYGLGLTLGNADMTLLELANAYTIFPDMGFYQKANSILEIKTADGKVYKPKIKKEEKVLSPETAFLISHILSDYQYKVPAFGVNSPLRYPFPFAAKTGTSKDFRDNFIVGYNQQFTIGVWVGNLFNVPMKQLPAALGAGIILRDIVLNLYNAGYPFRDFTPDHLGVQKAVICRLSGQAAGPECKDTQEEYFESGTEPHNGCNWHKNGKVYFPGIYKKWAEENYAKNSRMFLPDTELRIVHPLDNDIYKIDANRSLVNQRIPFEADSKYSGISWYVDGKITGTGKRIYWLPVPGSHTITAEVKGNRSIREDISIVVVGN
jgi:penicillin-binding protein 1C